MSTHPYIKVFYFFLFFVCFKYLGSCQITTQHPVTKETRMQQAQDAYKRIKVKIFFCFERKKNKEDMISKYFTTFTLM